MQAPQQRLHSSVILNGKRYRITRQGPELAFGLEMSPEPPYGEGLPPLVSEGQFTWHLGGFKSRQGVVGTSEYGVNTDTRKPYALIPSPQEQTVTLAGAITGNPHFVFTAGEYFYFIAGDTLWRVPRDGSLAAGGVVAQPVRSNGGIYFVMGLEWDNNPHLTDLNQTLWNLASTLAGTQQYLPTGAGNSTQWTPSAGSNFQNVDDPGADDGDATYNASATANQKDTFPFTDNTDVFTPSYASLTVRGRFRATSLVGAFAEIRLVVRLGGIELESPNKVISSTSYATYSHEFTYAPGPDYWTDANLDAAEFGYRLVIAPDNGECRVTQVDGSITWESFSDETSSALYLAVGPSRLFKIFDNGDGTSTLKNLAPGLALAEANWGDEVQITGALNVGSLALLDLIKVPLVAYQNTAIVATSLGVFGVSEDGLGVPILNRLVPPATSMVTVEPWLYVPSETALLRWVPGLVESVGLEQENLYDVPVSYGPVRHLAAHGKYLYAVVWSGPTDEQTILVGREAGSGEPTLGPLIWDTFADILDNSNHVPPFVAVLSDDPGQLGQLESSHSYLFYKPFSFNVCGYYILPHTAGHTDIFHPDYRFGLSGTRFSVKYRFDTWDDKSFSKIDIVGKNLSASVYWDIAYSIDGGAFQTTDINGSNMRKNTDGKSTFFLPLSAVGREVQFRFTYTSNSNTTRGTIEYWEVFALPQAQRQAVMVLGLTLEAHQVFEDGGFDERTSAQQLADLQSLVEAGVITAYGPWEEWYNSTNILVRSLRILGAKQSGAGEPVFSVELGLEIREVE